MKLYIKNMVCTRCKMVIRTELEKLKLRPVSVDLGEVAIKEKQLSQKQSKTVAEALKAVGFELLDDCKSQIISRIKSFVIETIHYKGQHQNKNYRGLISQHLHHDYSYLSNLFSGVVGITNNAIPFTNKTWWIR